MTNESATRVANLDAKTISRMFETMLPRIQLMAVGAFRHERRELREDLAQEVIGRAFVAFVRLAQQGKADPWYAAALAMYSARQVRSGRRLGTQQNANDISSEHCGIKRGVSLRRIDGHDRDGGWKQLAIEDKRTGPAELAAFRLDFAAWLQTLPPRKRRIAGELAFGDKPGEVAAKHRLSPSRISQMRRWLRASWEAFVGEPGEACGAAA